jgi:hypothetical protein
LLEAPPAASIPGDVFSAPAVGGVDTLLSSGGGVSGELTYQGRTLAEGATLTLADGHLYRISYRGGKGGHDVTLTRIADNGSMPPPSPAPKPLRAPSRGVPGCAADVARDFQTAEGYLWAHARTTADLFGLDADGLGRAPDPDGFDRWPAAAPAGAFLDSREEDQALAERSCADDLGRAADPAAAPWVEALASHRLSPAQVDEMVLASDECFSRAGAMGGTAGTAAPGCSI